MKKILILLVSIIYSLNTIASNEEIRIAVFDPVSSGDAIDAGTRIAIREIISSVIVNTGKYSLVERSMLEHVMEEQAFSNSGIVDDTQATEIGKLAGANKVIVSVITVAAGRYMLSIKMIDVKTAAVEKQQVKLLAPDELIFMVEPITKSMVTGIDNAESYIENEETESHEEQLSTATDEITLYLPSGNSVKKEEHSNNSINVFFDKKFVGSGTVGDGFKIALKNTEPGVHTLKFSTKRLGEMKFIKIDTEKYSYFKFGIRRWKYMGVEFYSVELVEER